MENLNYLFIGSSSELAEETLNLFSKKGFKVYGVSRRVNDISHFEDFLVVNDYLEELDKIIQFTEKINNCCVVFFNGFLAENRSEEVPSINEIVETDLANFNVPYSLTKALKEKTNSINKYIYISWDELLKLKRPDGTKLIEDMGADVFIKPNWDGEAQ